MRHRLALLAALFVFAVTPPGPARAQETQPGDACAAGDIHRARQVAGPENPGIGYLLVCDGSTWKIVDQWDTGTGNSLFQVDYDSDACDALKEGRLRYSSSGDLWEYCHSNLWTALGTADPEQVSGLTAPSSSEVDPQVGTMTNGKWCTSDGSAVNCTSDAPSPTCTRRTSSASASTRTVSCNAGEVMTGGGCLSSSTSATIEDSYPSADDTWTCEMSGSSTLTAYAICCAF